jgi:hypothetical protein
LFVLQHPSFWFFKDFYDLASSEEPSAKADKGVKLDKDDNPEPRVPFPCTFEFKPVLTGLGGELTTNSWARFLRINTNMANASLLPWTPLEASQWRDDCVKELRLFPGDQTVSKADILKNSVAAFGLIKSKAVRQALFAPKFATEPHGWWQENVFLAFNDIYTTDKAEVSSRAQ